jgi:hypothetical protein
MGSGVGFKDRTGTTMSIQRRARWIALLGCGVFALSGCAGLITPFINNPYAGNYNGTFSTSDGKTGPAAVQLTKLGNVFGTLTDTATKANGDLKGSVKSGLDFSGSLQFPGSSAHNLSGSFTSDHGVISGTVKGTDGYTLTITVNSNSTPASS